MVVILAMGFGVNVRGQEAADTLHEVVVTGTGTAHRLRDVPVQTEVISRRMLDSYGAKSFEEILGGLTSSFAFNEGDMGSQMQMGGLGNSYILILIDGKRIHGDVGGENDLSLIDPHNIDHIEIVRGAQSALYGSDAMAGVINIITRRHAFLAKGGVAAENVTRYGSYNDVRQHDAVGVTMGRATSYTTFQMQHNDGWRNTSQEYTEAMVVTDSRNRTTNNFTCLAAGERLSYALTPSTELYAEGSYYTKGIHRPQDGHYPSCDVYTYDLMYRNAGASVGGRWKSRRGDAVSLDVDWNKHAYYYEYTATTLTDGYDPTGRFTNYYPYFAGQRSLQSDQQRLMGTLKGIVGLPAGNLLNAGAEFRYDYLDAPMRTATGTASDWTAALYVQDEYTPLQWLNVTAGLRLNQNENFGFRATPKLSTMVSLGDFRLRAGWSQGFKTPTTKELHYRYLHTMGSTAFFNMGNTDLKAQRSNYWSAGLEYRGQKLTASVTGYWNRLDDMIVLVNVPEGEIPPSVTSAYGGDGSNAIIARRYKNMEDARTCGIDVNLSYALTAEWSLSGNYSWLDTKAHQYNMTKDRLVSATIDGMAHHRWSAQTTWNHRFGPRYRLGASLSTRGSSRRYYENNGNGRPYQLWRLSTTHDLGPTGRPLSYRVEAGVDDIFNYVDRTMHPYHLGTKASGTTVYASFSIRFQTGKRVKQQINKPNQNNYNDED